MAHCGWQVREQEGCHIDVSEARKVDGSGHHSHWARVPVVGAQAMAVAGVDVWLIQAFCRWGSRAVVEYIRDCHLSSAMDVATRVTRGLRLMEVRENISQPYGVEFGVRPRGGM